MSYNSGENIQSLKWDPVKKKEVGISVLCCCDVYLVCPGNHSCHCVCPAFVWLCWSLVLIKLLYQVEMWLSGPAFYLLMVRG